MSPQPACRRSVTALVDFPVPCRSPRNSHGHGVGLLGPRIQQAIASPQVRDKDRNCIAFSPHQTLRNHGKHLAVRLNTVPRCNENHYIEVPHHFTFLVSSNLGTI